VLGASPISEFFLGSLGQMTPAEILDAVELLSLVEEWLGGYLLISENVLEYRYSFL